MKQFDDLMERFRGRPVDVLGVHVDTNATRAVRLRKHGTSLSLIGAECLPPINLTDVTKNRGPLVALPARLRAPYAALTLNDNDALAKLLFLPSSPESQTPEKIAEQLGLKGKEDFRIVSRTLAEGHGKAEARILAVGIPLSTVKAAMRILPSGTPAPVSLELDGLATLTAFLHYADIVDITHPAVVVDFGPSSSTLAVIIKRSLVLLRRFEFGTESLADAVQQSLRVDRDTARGIITDGAFDITQPVQKAISPLAKQLIVSRDFCERRENCRVAHLYISGSLVAWRQVVDQLRAMLDIGIEQWDPFTGLDIANGAIPQGVQDRKHEFGAAVGACLATLGVV